MAKNVYVLGQPIDLATSWTNSFSNSGGELRALPDFNQTTITPGTKMTPSLQYVSVHVSSGKPEKPRLLSASGKPGKQSPLGNRREKLNLVGLNFGDFAPGVVALFVYTILYLPILIPTYTYLYELYPSRHTYTCRNLYLHQYGIAATLRSVSANQCRWHSRR